MVQQRALCGPCRTTGQRCRKKAATPSGISPPKPSVRLEPEARPSLTSSYRAPNQALGRPSATGARLPPARSLKPGRMAERAPTTAPSPTVTRACVSSIRPAL